MNFKNTRNFFLSLFYCLSKPQLFKDIKYNSFDIDNQESKISHFESETNPNPHKYKLTFLNILFSVIFFLFIKQEIDEKKKIESENLLQLTKNTTKKLSVLKKKDPEKKKKQESLLNMITMQKLFQEEEQQEQMQIIKQQQQIPEILLEQEQISKQQQQQQQQQIPEILPKPEHSQTIEIVKNNRQNNLGGQYFLLNDYEEKKDAKFVEKKDSLCQEKDKQVYQQKELFIKEQQKEVFIKEGEQNCQGKIDLQERVVEQASKKNIVPKSMIMNILFFIFILFTIGFLINGAIKSSL